VTRAIQRRLADRSNGDRQGGFTLIELMVVVMIIAILIGIAIPAFLGARRRAQDAAAKSNIRNALSSATAIFSDNQEYQDTTTTVGLLGDEEPSLTFVGAGTESTTEKTISVRVAQTTSTNDKIYLAVRSKSNNCFFVRHVNTPGLAGLSGSYQTKVEGAAAGTCDADATDVPADNAVDANGVSVWSVL
jgi:prepilin-type N-terminal cleavage/methylation domain-containing protein